MPIHITSHNLTTGTGGLLDVCSAYAICLRSLCLQVNTKASDNIREERERLSTALADRSAQFEEVKAAHDSLNRKLKAKEKRVRDLEDERLKVTEDLAVKVSS